MKREHILLIGTVLILALFGLGLFDKPSMRTGSGSTLRPDLTELGPADPVLSLNAGTSRDPFRETRDVEPLPRLDYPLPPVTALPTLLPPPIPDSGPSQWSENLLVHAKALPGGLEDLVDVGSQEEPDPGLQGDGLEIGEDEAYEEAYDSVRLDALSVRYGRLLGEDRYDKKNGEPILFQEVDPRDGTDRFAPQPLAGEDYESFKFAKTLRNEIELSIRRVNPNAAGLEDRLVLVRWLLAQGNQEPVAYEYAERLAIEGVGLGPDDIEAWLTLGEVWERTFKYDQAFTLYARMANETLPSAAVGTELGVEIAEGRFERRAAPRVRMAVILRQFGLDAEAEELLRTADALRDGVAAAPLELGVLLTETGRAAEAIPHLERALGMHANRNSAAGIRNGRALGTARLVAGDWAGAQKAFSDASRAATGLDQAYELAAGEVAAAYLGGDFATAYELSGDAVQNFGPHAQLLYLRGITGAANGEATAEVVRDLRQAARSSPLDAAPAFAALSFWYGVQGLEDEAATALADALDLDPELSYAIYLRARRSIENGDRQSAERDLRAFLVESPRCAAVLAELGWLLHEDARYAEAEVALRRAAMLARKWGEASLRRGLNLLRLGSIDEAKTAISEGQSAGASQSIARNAMAWAANAEGEPENAVGDLAFVQDLLREQEEDPQRLYAQEWESRLEAHMRMLRWSDDFEGRLLRERWGQDGRVGVEGRVLDGALQIRGQHTGPGRTRVTIEHPALDFISFAADFTVGTGHQGDAGVLLSLEPRGRRGGSPTWQFRVFRNREGMLRWESAQGTKIDPGTVPGGLGAGRTVRVKFFVDRQQEPPILTVTLDEDEIYSQPVQALRASALPIHAGCYTETARRQDVDCKLDNVEFIFLKN